MNEALNKCPVVVQLVYRYKYNGTCRVNADVRLSIYLKTLEKEVGGGRGQIVDFVSVVPKEPVEDPLHRDFLHDRRLLS